MISQSHNIREKTSCLVLPTPKESRVTPLSITRDRNLGWSYHISVATNQHVITNICDGLNIRDQEKCAFSTNIVMVSRNSYQTTSFVRLAMLEGKESTLQLRLDVPSHFQAFRSHRDLTDTFQLWLLTKASLELLEEPSERSPDWFEQFKERRMGEGLWQTLYR